MPLFALAQGQRPSSGHIATASHAVGTPDEASRLSYPRIPTEENCAYIHDLAMSGDAAQHYRWALRYVDRQDDPISGRCIGPAGLQIALQRLQNVIVARGYVTTRVVLASTAPLGDTLTFAVVPGRVGNVQFQPDLGRSTALRETVPLRHGALLNLRAIKQVLAELRPALASDADIRILPASRNESLHGESDLLIVWQPAPGSQAGLAFNTFQGRWAAPSHLLGSNSSVGP